MRKVYQEIAQIAGNVITVQASGVGNMELATVQAPGLLVAGAGDPPGGRPRDHAGVLGHARHPHRRGDPLLWASSSRRRSPRRCSGASSPAAACRATAGPLLDEGLIPIVGPPVNPARRIIPRNMIRTGIPMIDVFNSLVESQKLPIFSVAGEPYNQLLARIALNAEVDLIVLGGMGLKYDDYLYFRDTLEEEGALSRAILYVHTAADPVVECLLVPDTCLAVAEKFALAGKRVLVLLSDMTNFADSLKEVAITMEQIPSTRGYPGDLYSQLAARYEKAVDFEGAGSVTVLAVTTMPGDDVTHPIPDNTGYITEGQLYLRNGRIEPFGSLSRLKQQVNARTRDDHRTIMNTMIQLYAGFKESLEKQSMGFRMSTWDEKLLKYGALFEAQMMDLSVNIPLEEALDLGWRILGTCFTPQETGIPTSLVERFWPTAT